MSIQPRYLCVFVAGTLLLHGVVAPAQKGPIQKDAQKDAAQNKQQQETLSGEGTPYTADAIAAAWLVADHQTEIELSQIAIERANRPDVKELAKRMIAAHQRRIERLKPFLPANEAGFEQPADPGSRFIALKQEVNAQRRETLRDDFDAIHWREFDRSYLESELLSQQALGDAQAVFATHVSPSLSKELDQGMRLIENQIKETRDVLRELAPGVRNAQRRSPQD